jgi:hypothetical protein
VTGVSILGLSVLGTSVFGPSVLVPSVFWLQPKKERAELSSNIVRMLKYFIVIFLRFVI